MPTKSLLEIYTKNIAIYTETGSTIFYCEYKTFFDPFIFTKKNFNANSHKIYYQIRYSSKIYAFMSMYALLFAEYYRIEFKKENIIRDQIEL